MSVKIPNIRKVTADDCLQYISKPIGFSARVGAYSYTRSDIARRLNDGGYGLTVKGSTANICDLSFAIPTTLTRWNHNTSKRKVGLITKKYDDGGIEVKILCDDYMHTTTTFSASAFQQLAVRKKYKSENDEIVLDGVINTIPYVRYSIANATVYQTGLIYYDSNAHSREATFDVMLNYAPEFFPQKNYCYGMFYNTNTSISDISHPTFTEDPSTTVSFGVGFDFIIPILYDRIFGKNPLFILSGDVFKFAENMYYDLAPSVPNKFNSWNELHTYEAKISDEVTSTNCCSIVYNMILTESQSEALAYLDSGVLPSDAFLYPLDFEDLPIYDEDDDDDGEDNNNDGDNNRDFDENLPVVPRFTPSVLSNNNYYWLDVTQAQDFIRWFWSDVGQLTDIDVLLNKIQGLYNDLGSAVLMFRYMPVDIENIGGEGDTSNILLGMIEKAGQYITIKKESPKIVKIGSYKFTRSGQYKSFCDLSPYSQAMLYLPYFGFVNLDVDIFMYHTLTVYAVYDHLSGTIQYYLYYDDKSLINMYLAKMSVDIPITLQSKNERDSAIFNNIVNAMGSVVGGVSALESGNPLGAFILSNGLQNGVNSAPIIAKGYSGESGGLYTPSKCAIVWRYPTISKPDNFSTINGMMCNRAYRLSQLRNKGLTIVQNPRLTFTITSPTQEEIEDIYAQLEKGVIL